jgi:hypothetical protein
VHHEPPAADEAAERADALAEVTDPDFLGADAEGDPDDDVDAFGTGMQIEV